MGIKFSGTSTAPATFHRKQKLLFWARGRRQTLLMLLDLISISHIWYPDYNDGSAPYSMSTLKLLELSDICGMAHWGHMLSLSSDWSEGLRVCGLSLCYQITLCSCLAGPREVAALKSGLFSMKMKPLSNLEREKDLYDPCHPLLQLTFSLQGATGDTRGWR